MRFLPSKLKTPSYRAIASIVNRNRRLFLVSFTVNLLVALFEGSTFALVYLVLKVMEGESLANINGLGWLATFTQDWSRGTLFTALVLFTILLQLARSALLYMALVGLGYLSARARAQTVVLTFERIMSFEFAFASGYKVGDLAQYIQDAEVAIQVELQQWRKILIKTFTSVAYLYVLISISPLLSSVAALLALSLVALQNNLFPRLKRAALAVTQIVVEVVKQAVESIQGLRVIHSFGLQRATIDDLRPIVSSSARAMEHQERLSSLIEPINKSSLIATVGILLCAGFFVLGGNRGELIVSELFTFIAALNRLAGELNGFTGAFAGMARNSGRMARLNEILSIEPENMVRFDGHNFNGLVEGIRFEDLTLWYATNDTPTLRSINFEMPKGTVTALVGGSGAGKSSVADLLLGLYDPYQGRVSIDGVDLRDYSLESWRKKVGVVSQDTFIFNRSILDNIRYGVPDAVEAEVVRAAKDAQAHDFIMDLPEGYQTVVGERGYRLSGGQRQRLALARAILKCPEILVLDEATSALDSQSEQLVQEALSMFQQDRTALVVAHRLSTISGADQILVLEKGEIVERGTHRELLAAGGRYAHYWQLQAGEPRHLDLDLSAQQ